MRKYFNHATTPEQAASIVIYGTIIMIVFALLVISFFIYKARQKQNNPQVRISKIWGIIIIVTMILLMIGINCKAQDEPTVSANFSGNFSTKLLPGFYGGVYRPATVEAGIWVNAPNFIHFSITAGYAWNQSDIKSPIVEHFIVTISTRTTITIPVGPERELKTWISPFFTDGTANYQDYGLRIGVHINNDRNAVGLMRSRNIKYGICLMMSIFK